MSDDPLTRGLLRHLSVGFGVCSCGWVVDSLNWQKNAHLEHVAESLREEFVVVPREDLTEDGIIAEIARHRTSPVGLCACGFDHRSAPGTAVWDTLSTHLGRECTSYIQILERRFEE